MRKIRYWITFLTTFLARFKNLLLGSIVLGVLLFLFSSQLSGIASYLQPKDTIGIVGRLSLDDLPNSIQNEIGTGLTRLDENNIPQPGLATSWYPEEEGRVWVFELGDYKWQDGSKIQASDINYRFTDVTKEIVDANTIKFRLRDPFAPFPTIVSRPIFKKGLVGTGDWKVARLSSFNAQFTQSLQLVNVKTNEKKIYRFYRTEEEARTAFKLGQVSKLQEIVDPKDLINWKNATIDVTSHEDRYVGIFLNVQDSFYQDKSARQALAYAINKDRFPENRAVSVIAPNSWAFNPQVKEYPYNPERSKELLKSSGLSEEARKNLSITLVTTPGLLSIADRIKEDWEAIGIKTHIQVANTAPQEFQSLLHILSIPSDPDQYSLWHSTQAQTNITNYGEIPSGQDKPTTKESPRIDKLLEDGRRILDEEERRAVYYDFQRFLLEDLPVIPLFHPVTYTITRK